MRWHTLEFRSAHEADTHALGAALGQLLHAGSGVLIFGGLGAGKTCLVRGVAQGLGLDPAQVHSPTFALLHRYQPSPSAIAPAPGVPHDQRTHPCVPLIHIDAYRLGHADDPDSLGLDAAQPDLAATAIEWPERLPRQPDGTLPRDLAAVAWAGVWISPEPEPPPAPQTPAGTSRHTPHDAPSSRRLVTLRVPAAWLDDTANPHATALRRACGGIVAPTAPDLDEPQDWLARSRGTPSASPVPSDPSSHAAPPSADGAADTPAHTPCPVTGRPVLRTSPSWPFADERARMADLHRWLTERYRIPD